MARIMKIKRVDSNEGNVSKYVFTKDDMVAEAVLYRYPTYNKRTVVCCSTQSGCPVGCRFCGAGDNFVRNLSAGEIYKQVEYCIEQTEVDSRDIERLQIMFMSMGEPLLNLHQVDTAIRALNMAYPNAELLLSTIGPDVPMKQLFEVSEDIDKVGLQFSVHESTDEARDKIIPFKRKLTLKQIADVGYNWWLMTKRKPFFNYCANDDNTSQEDADRLAKLFCPVWWNCTISVICERNEGIPSKNAHQRELARAFSEKMLLHEFDVRVFDPAGQDDIGGGCGQLWYVQEWMREHDDLTRPSAGSNLPIIEVPR